MNTQAAPYFISTSIPYVNGRPHIGHAMEYVLTDALARAHGLFGDDVWFATGADENSLKNVQAAEKEGIPVADLVARNAGVFRELADRLGTSYDSFLRTSIATEHVAGVRKLWEACAANGDIYQGHYRGLYCVGCEQFYTEEELVGGVCPEHLTAPEVIEEENYFFRLSRYAGPLIALIESDRLRVWPPARKNEILSFLRGGLTDLSISRSKARARGWGIPTPGDPGQVVYVWFDALANYITVLGYGDAGPEPVEGHLREPPFDKLRARGDAYRRYWTANPRRVHVIGKGILRFHAVYWPAFLLSAGAPLPTTLVVHGYLTVEGQKMSKSLGNVVDPAEIVQTYGQDALRYFLLRHTPAADDSDFARGRLELAYNSELADQLGNLLSRTVSMVVKYYDGVVPAPGIGDEHADRLAELGAGLAARVRDAVERLALHEALAAIWEMIGAANKYVVEVSPWTLAKARAAGDMAAGDRLATALYALIETLRLAAILCEPFIPSAAARIAAQLGLGDGWRGGSLGWGGYAPGARVQPGPALFPKR
jgi:methionyl-tRNA synthetase